MKKRKKKVISNPHSYVQQEHIDASIRTLYQNLTDAQAAMHNISYASRAVNDAGRECYYMKYIVKNMAKAFAKYAAHTQDCAWNEVVIGSMKDEEKECTCGVFVAKKNARVIARRKLDEKWV